MNTKKRLSRQHEAFCYNYIKENFNITKAYQKTYKCKNHDSARKGGSKVYNRPDVQEFLRTLADEQLSDMVADMVL